MPLPDETPRQSVANLIGRFEQGGPKKSTPSATPSTALPSSSTKSFGGTTKKAEPSEVPTEMSVPKDNGKPTPAARTRTTPRQSATSPKPIPKSKPSTTTTPATTTPKRTGTTVTKTETRPPASKTASSGTTTVPIRAQHTGSSVGRAQGGATKTAKSPPRPSQGTIAPAAVATPPRAKTPSTSRSRLYAPTAASLARTSGDTAPPKPKTTTSTPTRAPPKKVTSTPATSRTVPATSRPKTPSSTRKPTVTPAATTRKAPASSPPAKSRTAIIAGATPRKKSIHAPTSSVDKQPTTTESPPHAELVADPDASFAETEFAGNVTHLSSQTQGEQEIESYDDDFPETETEENQVLPAELSQADEAATVDPAHTDEAAAAALEEESAAVEEDVVQPATPEHEAPIVIEHQEAAHVAEVEEPAEILASPEPAPTSDLEEHSLQGAEPVQEHVSEQGIEEIKANGVGEDHGEPLEVNGTAPTEDEVTETLTKEEHNGAEPAALDDEKEEKHVAEDEEPAFPEADVGAPSEEKPTSPEPEADAPPVKEPASPEPEDEAPSVEELGSPAAEADTLPEEDPVHIQQNLSAKISSPDLNDAVQMLEAVHVSPSKQAEEGSDADGHSSGPDEY